MLTAIVAMTDDTGDDQSWVLDSLVGFLKGPLWSSSLNNFIDQKSIGMNGYI